MLEGCPFLGGSLIGGSTDEDLNSGFMTISFLHVVSLVPEEESGRQQSQASLVNATVAVLMTSLVVAIVIIVVVLAYIRRARTKSDVLCDEKSEYPASTAASEIPDADDADDDDGDDDDENISSS